MPGGGLALAVLPMVTEEVAFPALDWRQSYVIEHEERRGYDGSVYALRDENTGKGFEDCP